MNVRKVINQLQTEYPGKNIIKNNLVNTTEIICEIDPTSVHPDYNLAIVVIDKSKPHYHKRITEVYEVLKGDLIVNKDGKDYVLKPGDKITIHPGEVHFAYGNETWFKVSSKPGWTFSDHILVDEEVV